MSDHASLLIELGTEELPPAALDDLAAAFARGICAGLDKQSIPADTAHARVFCTPRRLAVWVPAVAAMQPDRSVERRGPSVKAGRDQDGAPTRALRGFAQSCGVEVEALDVLETDKGSWFVHRGVTPGQPLAALLPRMLAEAVAALPIPRPMRWGAHDYHFVRPVHWLVMLHGSEVVPGELLGLASGRQSRGHRFHHPQPVHVADADSWLDAMRAAHVLADPAERRERVRHEVAQAAVATGGTPRLSAGLLEEIANLTEWPVAIACAFEPEFLDVPTAALVTTMEVKQKFVPVFAADGSLSAHFIGVANIASTDPAEIRKGYERVIRPRFADAQFFYREDLKTPLADYQPQLQRVTYQQALGSLWDKTCRVAELARVVANRVGVDAGLATHAASLSRCDLVTRMVGEFPELQGVMGRCYATAQGEPADVAAALDDFYEPRHAGDPIAANKLARVLAVADRLDTLAGIFAVGMQPSGSKDPFALRRAALGLARTLVEGELAIDLEGALREALELVPDGALATGLARGKDGKAPPLDAGARRAALAVELHAFVLERLRGYYAEQGFGANLFAAVAAVEPATLPDFDRRLRAVAAFAARPEAASLAAANKRVGNILRQQSAAGIEPAAGVAAALFDHPAESALAAALDAAREDNGPAVASGDYRAVLDRLAALQAPVDVFFDQVLVATDDAARRANRLALLASLKADFTAVADIARL